MRRYGASTVGTYIASSPRKARPILRGLRRIVKTALPNVDERISWGVPFYWLNNRPIAGYATFRDHVTFGLGGPNLPTQIRKTLEKKGYRTGKKTVQIRFGQKIPEMEIEKLLRRQARINAAGRRVRRL